MLGPRPCRPGAAARRAESRLAVRLPPGSALAQAVGYALNQREGAAPVHRRRPIDDRQQQGGAPGSRSGDRSQELDVPGKRRSGPGVRRSSARSWLVPSGIGSPWAYINDVILHSRPMRPRGRRSFATGLLGRGAPDQILSHRLEEPRQKRAPDERQRGDPALELSRRATGSHTCAGRRHVPSCTVCRSYPWESRTLTLRRDRQVSPQVFPL